MPGTLSATVNVFAPQAVPGGFSASGQLDTGGFVPIIPMAVGFGQGGVVPAHFSRFDFPEGSGATTLSADGLHTMAISNAVKGWNNGPGFLTFSANGTVGDTAVRALATWTFSAVVNVASGPSGDFTVFSHASAFFINILTDGRLRLYTTGLGTITSAAAPFTFGVPHRITVTSDGTTVREYVDGVQVLSVAGALPADLINASKCLEDWSGGATPTAAMDSLTFWNVALTPAQVATLTAPTGTAEGTFAPTVAVQTAAGAPLFGAGVTAATFKQIYNMANLPKKPALTATGTFSATGYNTFTPYNVSTGIGTTAVPIGTMGCYLTLCAGGGRGGRGYSAGLGTAKGGGGGGGGGGRVGRIFISRSQMSSTYSATEGVEMQASSFTSGSKSIVCNPGQNGQELQGSGTNLGGAGGTVVITGFTGINTYANGGTGGTGDASHVGAPGSHSGGGGGGGAGNAFGASSNAGGAGATGGGNGGTGNVTIAGTAGAAGTTPGGGSGGGGGGNPGGGMGVAGNGEILIEWI